MLTNDLSHATDNLKMANRKKVQLEEHQTNLKALTDLTASADKDLAEIYKKQETLDQLRKDYCKIREKVTKKQENINGLRKIVGELRDKITEPFQGDLAELQEAIRNFDYIQDQKEKVLSGVSQMSFCYASARLGKSMRSPDQTQYQYSA